MALCPTCQTIRGQWDETCTKCGFSYKALDIAKNEAVTKAADVAAGCPSCGAVRPAGETNCPGCGIVYSKWKPKERLIMATPGTVTPLYGKNEHKERPGCLTFMMVGTVLLNGGAALLLSFVHIPGIPVGPLIAISVATAVFAVWVLRWKRWAVYGIVLVQLLGITSVFLSGLSLANLIQPVLVLWLFYYFVNPIWYHFD